MTDKLDGGSVIIGYNSSQSHPFAPECATSEFATVRAGGTNNTLIAQKAGQPLHTLLPATIKELLDSGELDSSSLRLSSYVPEQTYKVLPSLGSGSRNMSTQPLASASDLAHLPKPLAPCFSKQRGQASQEAAGDLKGIGAWTPSLPQPNVVQHTGRQDSILSEVTTLRTKCPYHCRNHDAETISAVLYQRSFRRATAHSCTCRDNFGAIGLIPRASHVLFPLCHKPDVANNSKDQPRPDRCNADRKPSSWNSHGHHGQLDLAAVTRLMDCATDSAPDPHAATAKPSDRTALVANRKYSTTQISGKAPPHTSASPPASTEANPRNSALSSPKQSKQSTQAFTPTTGSSNQGPRRKRSRRDDSRSPSRGKKPAPHDRNSTSNKYPCIYFQHDPAKFESCERRVYRGFKGLRAHVLEHVRPHQCGRCGMRAGKEHNLLSHQQNSIRICQLQDQQLWSQPAVTAEELERFRAIKAAETQHDLEKAVFHPTLFEKDYVMVARWPRQPAMHDGKPESSGLPSSSSNPLTHPEGSQTKSCTPQIISKPPCQPEGSEDPLDMVSRMKEMMGDIVDLKAAVLNMSHTIDYLKSKVDSKENAVLQPMPDIQNLLAIESPVPERCSARCQKERQNYEARLRKLEEVQMPRRRVFYGHQGVDLTDVSHTPHDWADTASPQKAPPAPSPQNAYDTGGHLDGELNTTEDPGSLNYDDFIEFDQGDVGGLNH